nr:MAG TPA: hypothetical protein [Bacteriophage sp.]
MVKILIFMVQTNLVSFIGRNKVTSYFCVII